MAIKINNVHGCTLFRPCEIYNTIVFVGHALPDFETLTANIVKDSENIDLKRSFKRSLKYVGEKCCVKP